MTAAAREETSDAGTARRPLVGVQGLGFVGTAMALAVASARRSDGSPAFDVVGVELDNPVGRERVTKIRAGQTPIRTSDRRMSEAMTHAVETGNFAATTDEAVYERAAVAIVDIGLDLDIVEGRPSVDFTELKRAIRSLSSRMLPESLILVETTVPPGTCADVIAPEIERMLEHRGLPADSILLAHAYERVMPGPDYLDSIINFWRVYAGHTEKAADAAERFLAQVVNVGEYPLTRLASTTASEVSKLLENSYRAANIAFMEEWGRFAEAAGVDLYEVIEAIRMRPTHSNIRQPGFGVGGYCLTKDPLFAEYGARELFGFDQLAFPFSERAVEVNNAMPLVTLDKLEELLDGLDGKRILLLGVSYRDGVADTRNSPSRVFVVGAIARGADVVVHDPLVTHWDHYGALPSQIPSAEGFDAVVFAVPHAEYVSMDLRDWLGEATPLIVDANNVISTQRLRKLVEDGCPVWSIGRGAL